MDREEQILDQKLREADENSSHNVGITTAFFSESYLKDCDSSSTRISFPVAVANMPSSRSSSPKKPYQATVEDYNSDSDLTLTEAEPKEPPPGTTPRPLKSILKDPSKPSYSNVRKGKKLRFSRQDSDGVHPPKDEQPRKPERQNSSKPLHREKKIKGREMSAVDLKWGQLFTDQWKPTDRLRSVYRGIANYLMSEYDREGTIIRLCKLHMFFERFPGGPVPPKVGAHGEVITSETILYAPYHQLIDIFVATKCDYHLVPATNGGVAHEPALTSRGFAQLMQTYAQTNPDREVARLNDIIKELPIEAELQPGGQMERLPKQISRHLFPPEPNAALAERLANMLPQITSWASSPEDSQGSPRRKGFSTSPYPESRFSHQRIIPYYPEDNHRPSQSHWHSHWQPWDETRSNRFDNSTRYTPSSSSSSSTTGSRSPSPKAPRHRRRSERSPSRSRKRRNSSPVRHERLSTRPRRHSDAVPRRGGLLSGLAALGLHSRRDEDRREESRREDRRRRSYEPSPVRRHVHYGVGTARTGSGIESVPRSERDRGRDEGRGRRESAREAFATPRW